MRKTLSLLLAFVTLTLAACRTAKPADLQGTPAPRSAAPEPIVFVDDLAEQMGFRYAEDRRGFVELKQGRDAIVLTPGSRQAMVNGRAVQMGEPCLRMAGGYALRTSDARMIRTRVARRRGPSSVARAAPAAFPLPAAWRPRAKERPWRHIIVHHSVSSQGSAAFLDRVHRARGFDSLGYHFVIGNGNGSGDGRIEVGSRWTRQQVGAHARVDPNDDNYWNRNSIGIVLVGDFTKNRPTRAQMDSLIRLVRALRAHYRIATGNVIPHRAVKGTLCPGPRFPWNELQRGIR